MSLKVQLHLKDNEQKPESLENGDMLRVANALSGIIPIAQQITAHAGRFDCIEQALVSTFGAGQVTGGPTPDPVIYKYLWDDEEMVWIRVCCWMAALDVSFATPSVVTVSVESGEPYGASSKDPSETTTTSVGG